MKPVLRAYQTDDDYWRMRDFLRRVFLLNGRLERSWHVARLDYARWHTCLNLIDVGFEELVNLWESDGELVAIVMPDGPAGEAHFLVHPDFRTPELESEMLDVAEERLATVRPDAGRRLRVWVPAADELRHELVISRGYTMQGLLEHQWRRDLDGPVEPASIPAGYTLRSLGDGLELLERCYASGLGFHDGDIAIAVNNREDSTWYRNIQMAPLYRRDLDLVAIAPDGSIAAFCTIWLDDVTRSAYYEPVATVPAHQRRGLGRALLTEGLRRLQRMGATRALVGGYTPAANGLYQSVMGPQHELVEPWVREW